VVCVVGGFDEVDADADANANANADAVRGSIGRRRCYNYSPLSVLAWAKEKGDRHVFFRR
jgi:hypothetical protein